MRRCKHTLRIFAWQLDSMPEYSTSLPTATTPFRMWKNNSIFQGSKKIWRVGQYYPVEEPGWIGIRWFKVDFLAGPKPREWSPPDWGNYERYKRERALHAFPKHITPSR